MEPQLSSRFSVSHSPRKQLFQNSSLFHSRRSATSCRLCLYKNRPRTYVDRLIPASARRRSDFNAAAQKHYQNCSALARSCASLAAWRLVSIRVVLAAALALQGRPLRLCKTQSAEQLLCCKTRAKRRRPVQRTGTWSAARPARRRRRPSALERLVDQRLCKLDGHRLPRRPAIRDKKR